MPQSMPVCRLAIVPDPLPVLVVVRVSGISVNRAVTFWLWSIVTVQVGAVPVPVQAPVQPSKVEPVAGVAVRVTNTAGL